jgi:hypothetical protein
VIILIVPNRKINFQVVCIDNKDYLNIQKALQASICDYLRDNKDDDVMALLRLYCKYFSKVVEVYNED